MPEATSGYRDSIGNRMVTSTMETASTLDQATLDALRASVASVLAEQCGSTKLHANIDGKNTLDKTFWAKPSAWLAGILNSRATRGSLACVPKVLPSSMSNWGGNLLGADNRRPRGPQAIRSRRAMSIRRR